MLILLLTVVTPVFLLVGLGYTAARFGGFAAAGVDGLNQFAQRLAIPCLLFEAVRNLEFDESANITMLGSFYGAAFISFFLGYIGARKLFNRRPGEAVAVGFAAFFSNTVLMGLTITERAYGAEALGPNYAIAALHAPVLYLIGISAMEVLRADGRGFYETLLTIVQSVFSNPLMIGIALGWVANLAGFTMPEVIKAALDMIITAALPVALFALGGVLTRYQLSDKIPQVLFIACLSLVVHPLLTWLFTAHLFELENQFIRSSVLTAAMAPGINAYIFASIYDRATGVNSAAVLLCTVLSVVTVPVWLSILA